MTQTRNKLTQEDTALIQLMMNNGETREQATSKVHSGVYSLKQGDFNTIADLCVCHGPEYREQALQQLFKRNREKCKRLILAKKSRIENPKILKEVGKEFSWVASIQKR